MKEDEMLLETIKEIGGDLSRVRADNEKTEAMLNRMEKGVGYEAMKAVLENELMRQAKLEQVVNWLVELRRLKKEKRSKGHWNNHQIACMLADLFGDACACNYNGIDEWLSELCDFKDTCCPNPVGVACWEQFLKHRAERRTDE